MLISIHDKTLQRVGFIDNDKPDTLHFYNDTWHRYLTEATSTFDFTVPKTGHASLQFLTEKHYVSFRYEGKDYLFNIMKIEETETELTCYTENLNLELLNEISPAYTAPQAMTFEQYFNNSDIVGGQDFSDVVLGINEVSDYSRTLSWEGTETKLARLLSLVNKFDAECEFVTELNRDGSLNRIVLNVYKQHDDDHQGVGTRRQDVTLYYGKSIKSVRRTVDKTELYSAIYPTGKDGLTITNLDKTEYDADGNVLYYTHTGQPNIYAPQTAEEYPTQISTAGDKWILYRWEYDTDNVNTLYGQALAKLKDISQPALTYEIEGTYDLAIGDMVIIHDDKFTPTLLLEARVSEQEISFTNPSQNKNIYSNFKALENQLSTDITSRLDEIRAEAAPYTAEILTDNGMFFKNGEGTTTLTARIMRAGNDVTSQVALQWTKDGTPVSTNASITITAEQVPTKANYRLTVKNAGGTVLCTAEVTIARVDDGEDGEGIQSVDMEYCQSDSETTPPANNDPGWSTNPPTRLDGKHVWQRTVITYTSGMEITTTPICITGQQGKDGVSATAIEEEYYLSLSNTEQVGGSWTLTCPEWQNGHYIWTRSKISWSNGDTTYTTPVLAGGLNSANSNASNAQNTANNALGQVEAAVIRVGNLEADNVTINGKLTAAEAAITKLQTDIAEVGDLSAINAEIENLKAQDVTITGRLDAVDASIDNLETETAKIGTLEADIAKIGDLEAGTGWFGELKAQNVTVTGKLDALEGNFDTLESDFGAFKILTTDKITAVEGTINNLSSQYANIDFANIGEAAIEKLFSDSGIIGDLVMQDGHVTGELVGVTIKGDLIEGNTIVADKLVIKGEGGLYYQLNTDGEKVTSQQTAYNSLNGSVITAQSVTADKINVTDLVAFGATIGGFTIDSNAIHTNAKTNPNSTISGIYLDNAGQFGVGDGNSYMRYYKDSTGKFKLEISAASVKFSSSNQSIADAIGDLQDDIDNIELTPGPQGPKGDPGTDGKDGVSVSITSTAITYQASTSGTTIPTGTWLTSIPAVSAGQYLWTRTVVKYSDGKSTTAYSVGKMGNTGAKGDKGDTGSKGTDGRGVSSTVLHYAASTSGTAIPSNWQTTIPTLSAGQYLWTRTTFNYTTGNPSYSYSVGMKGATGAQGPAGANGKMLYGTCSTAAGTAAKTATVSGFSLYTGVTVAITFTNANTAASPTLKIGNTAAKAIQINNAAMTASNGWSAGACVTFVYDGTYYRVTDSSIALKTITNWCYKNNTTYIDGANIYAGSITADKIRAGSITIGYLDSTTQTKINNGNTALTLVTVQDTRDTNQNPSWYMSTYPKRTVREFKSCSKIGLSGSTYCTLETYVPWSDSSGGYPTQVAYLGTGGTAYKRTGTSNTAWSTWKSVEITVANWCYDNNTTYIDGGKIYTGSLSADKITTGTLRAVTIQSTNYVSGSTGMKILLSNGTIDSKNFKIKSDNSVEVTGVFKTTGSGFTSKLSSDSLSFYKDSNQSEELSKITATKYEVVDPGTGTPFVSGKISMISDYIDIRGYLHIGYKDTDHYIRIDATDFDFWGSGTTFFHGGTETWGAALFKSSVTVNGSSTLKALTCSSLTVNGKSLLNRTYPVGSIYMSVNSTNPGTLFGGTWVELQGRFLIGRSSSYTNGSTGGASTVALSTAQMPSHSHQAYSRNYEVQQASSTNIAGNHGGTIGSWGIQNSGGSGSHNNMPPYLAVYMWKRTA